MAKVRRSVLASLFAFAYDVDSGRIFLEDAKRVLSLAATAAKTARRVEQGEIGQLKIGFIKSTAFAPIFSKIINTYRTRFPKVKLSLQEMSTMRQIAALTDFSLDLGFIRPPEMDMSSQLVVTPLRTHSLSVVLPEHHRLAKAPHITLEDLRDEELIMFPRDEGTTLNPQIYRLCADAGFAPKIAMEAREAATIIGLIAAGCGVSILPELFSSMEIKGAVFRPIETPAAVVKLVLASRAQESGTLPKAFSDIAAELVPA